jgi:enoyl-CoA hydratase/carnithine racemase
MTETRVVLERSDEVATLTFNNPRLRNAMDEQMLSELIDACRTLEQDSRTRFVILKGADNSFMAGVDLTSKAMSDKGDPGSARLKQRQGQELIRLLGNLEQVTIAAVDGPCIGAGIAVALACDLRIASETAMWSLPNTHLGYFFSWGSTPLLVRLVGPAQAKELILTCRRIDSAEAMRIGLVNRIVSSSGLVQATHDIVRDMAANWPLAIRLAKKVVNSVSAVSFGDVSVSEPELIERLYVSGEPTEGTQAFLEKRAPRFR